MSSLDFILLYTTLFGLFFSISQIRQKAINRNVLTWGVPIIIAFVIIIGMRYGWGNDYMSYKYWMDNPKGDENVLFAEINTILSWMGFEYVEKFMFYALCLIVGGLAFLRTFRYNKYMIAFFLPAMFSSATFMIRQGFALSFFFLSVYYLWKKNHAIGIFFLILSIGIHTGLLSIIIFPFLFMFLHKWYKKPLPILYTIPIYTAITIGVDYINTFFATNFTTAFTFLQYFGKFESYSENNEYWFGEEGINEIYEQSIATMLMTLIFEVSIIYLGAKALYRKYNKRVCIYYNSVIAGMFIMRSGFYLEIIHRIGQSIMAFYFVPLGYAFSIFLKRKVLTSMPKSERTLTITAICCCIAFILLFYGRTILLSPEKEFIWNN